MHLELTRKSIRTLVEIFYGDVRSDERLSVIFNAQVGGHWEAHVDRLVVFWCTVMLATSEYRGNVYGIHMRVAGIDSDHFVRWLKLFEKNTTMLFSPEVSEEFIKVARRIAASLEYGIVGEVLRSNDHGS